MQEQCNLCSAASLDTLGKILGNCFYVFIGGGKNKSNGLIRSVTTYHMKAIFSDFHYTNSISGVTSQASAVGRSAK